MEADATTAGIELGGKYLEEAGALSFTLAFLLILALGAIAWMVWTSHRRYEQAVKTAHAACRKEIENRDQEIETLKITHISELDTLKVRLTKEFTTRYDRLCRDYASLTEQFFNAQGEWARRVDQFRSSINDFYKEQQRASLEAAHNNTKNVEAMTLAAEALRNLPKFMELSLSSKSMGTRLSHSEGTDAGRTG